MRLFLGARMLRLAQLRFAAPLATAQARSARPLRRSFRRHFAQCLGGLEQETRRRKSRQGVNANRGSALNAVKWPESSGILGRNVEIN